jgi:hypothetical protein
MSCEDDVTLPGGGWPVVHGSGTIAEGAGKRQATASTSW